MLRVAVSETTTYSSRKIFLKKIKKFCPKLWQFFDLMCIYIIEGKFTCVDSAKSPCCPAKVQRQLHIGSRHACLNGALCRLFGEVMK